MPPKRKTPKLNTAKCHTCGYIWPIGMHGGHSCSGILREEVDRLKIIEVKYLKLTQGKNNG